MWEITNVVSSCALHRFINILTPFREPKYEPTAESGAESPNHNTTISSIVPASL